MKKLMVLTVMTASSTTFALDGNLRLSDEAVSLQVGQNFSQMNAAEVGLLYNNDEDSMLLHGGLFATGERDAFKARVGGKAYYADLDHDSGYGVALGGELNLSMTRHWGLDLGLYLGPGALSFSDIDGYQEWFIRATYQILPNARLGAGFIQIELEPEEGRDVELEDGVFVEMTMSF